jgi:hypothetical protein
VEEVEDDHLGDRLPLALTCHRKAKGRPDVY